MMRVPLIVSPSHSWLGRASARLAIVLTTVYAVGSSACLAPAQPAGVADAPVAQSDAGPIDDGCDGQWIEVDGERLCVVISAATETGFQCPPEMFEYGGFGWSGCGPEGMSDEEVETEVIAQDALGCGQLELDILLMMDTSTSMCGEQVGIAEAVKNFAAMIADYDADLRIAATTADASCDYDPEHGIIASKGRFVQSAAASFPAPCYFKTRSACSTDSDCGDSGFRCTPENLEVCIETPNGSINTTCRPLCTSDADCHEKVGPAAVCRSPGGIEDSGCIIEPDTGHCPASFGPVLTHDDADLLSCVSTPGVYSQKCFAYEQGLKSAWLALDPEGDLAAQSQLLLRPDARLAIVFITDEDDCSTATDEKLAEDHFNTCSFLGDTTTGGPLVPVAEIADKFRGLKSDPSLVSVLAIAGDSLSSSEADKQADRQAYQLSKTDVRTCHQKSYICEGQIGAADWGSRYHTLAELFGSNGIFKNICSAEQFGGAFGELLVTVKDGYLKSCEAKNQR